MRQTLGWAALACGGLVACDSSEVAFSTTTTPMTSSTTVPSARPAPTTSVATTADGEISIVDVRERFELYVGCGNEPIRLDGVTYCTVRPEQLESINRSPHPVPAESIPPGGLRRVAPPGPGDDIGTMVVYSDGVARHETDSRLVTWFWTRPHSYEWAC